MFNHFIILNFCIYVIIRPVRLHLISICVKTKRINIMYSLNYLFRPAILDI